MNIKAIPDGYDEFERFNVEYERERFRCTEASRRLGAVTRDLFLGWFPWVPRVLGAPAIYALIDDHLLDAFGFPHPSSRVRRAVEASLRLRGRAVRLLPPRRRPRLRPELRHRAYPGGYRIEELGPPGSRRERVRARHAAPPPS
jgi:hypothetical protein